MLPMTPRRNVTLKEKGVFFDLFTCIRYFFMANRHRQRSATEPATCYVRSIRERGQSLRNGMGNEGQFVAN
jgi:hypothetical protein